MLYIRLFHGRSDPNQQMDDWGINDPVFGPYQFAHMTYNQDIKLGKTEGNCDELYVCQGDLVYYDGMYYGDWSVFDTKVFEKSNFSKTVFEQEKANLPKNIVNDLLMCNLKKWRSNMANKNTEQGKIMTLMKLKQLLVELGREVGDDFEVWLSRDEEGNEFLPMLENIRLSLGINKEAKRIVFFPSHR